MHLELSDLTYAYPHHTDFRLGPVSATLGQAGIIGLIGANGSGKTTLLRIIIGQIVEYGGAYQIDGQPVASLTGDLCARYGIGYAPEHPELDDRLTGFEILSLVKDIRGIADAAFDTAMALYHEHLNLGPWLREKPCDEYSQGMQRKTALMIAFLGAPRFLALDEPTNGLDPLATYGLKRLITRYRSEGVGILISSHILDMVEKIADELIMLKSGSVVYSGRLDALKAGHNDKSSLDDIYFSLAT
jgi:ABC-type multidrug transport system ATPase subunit